MKFKISHLTKWIHCGIFFPWPAAIAAILIYLFLGFDISNELPTYILFGVFALCAAVESVFILLFIAEKIYGAKITVEYDHIDVKMILRHKKISFADIENMKYRHYYESDEDEHSWLNKLFTPHENDEDHSRRIRSKLIFYLSSGKVLTLNDKADGYRQKQTLWITDPDIDPDENVKLYQAYRCCVSASRQYWNKQK